MKHFTRLALPCLLGSILMLPATAAAQAIVFGNGAAGQCYQSTKMGNPGLSSAIRTCTQALSDPLSRNDLAATHVNRGVLHMRAGRQADAIADYEAALKIDDSLSETYVNYGASLIYENRLDEALTTLNHALSVLPEEKFPEAYFNRALAHDRKGDYTNAWRDLRAALALRPDWAPAVKAIARYDVKTSG